MSTKDILAVAMESAGLTAQGAVDLLKGVSESTETQVAKMRTLIDSLSQMALPDGRSFLKAVVASTKATKADKPDPVIKQRASEAGTLYGAVKLIPKFSYEGMGWNRAVVAAREALKSAKIKADGNRVLSDVEQFEKTVSDNFSAQDARRIIGDTSLTAEERVAALARLDQDAAHRASSAKVLDHARRIIKGNGTEYAGKLVEALETLIGQAEQEQAQVEQKVATLPIPAQMASKKGNKGGEQKVA